MLRLKGTLLVIMIVGIISGCSGGSVSKEAASTVQRVFETAIEKDTAAFENEIQHWGKATFNVSGAKAEFMSFVSKEGGLEKLKIKPIDPSDIKEEAIESANKRYGEGVWALVYVDSEKEGVSFVLEKIKDRYYVVDVNDGDYFEDAVKDWSKYDSD